METTKKETIISIKNGVALNPLFRFKEPINFHVSIGEQIAIIGPNGSGKSILVNTIRGQYPLFDNNLSKNRYNSRVVKSDKLAYILFRDSYGESDSTFYYQQRWNNTEIDHYPKVKDLLPVINDKAWRDELFSLFSIDNIHEKRLVSLSSGEMRKFQLVKALSTHPKIIIIDNPFIGLDKKSRDNISILLEKIIDRWRLHVITVVSRNVDIAKFITHVVPVKKMVCGIKQTKTDYLKRENCTITYPGLSNVTKKKIAQISTQISETDIIVDFRKVSLKYGDKVVLNRLNWVVRNGEKWALLGPNGSGKSALLSLIYADNPQSYAYEITLFGKKRGSGESIWDIKNRIGYVSPELHRSYVRHLSVESVIASGLRNSIGLYGKINDKERHICSVWMDIFDISHFAHRDFFTLSSGEQRLVLLARAFVKDPLLLILDEPFHGLDSYNRELVMDIIYSFCNRAGKTLILVTHYPEELPKFINRSLILSPQQ
ncbi:MAG TPA: ATP-binding cassette domain-containing protein [Bacteroidaceae bacterium]|nr:ATP-binding cassette domain-containing protein [Bacteroidaceae bacterium]